MLGLTWLALRSAGEAVFGFLERLSPIVYVVAALAAYGAYQHHRVEAQKEADNRAALAQAHAATSASEQARAKEQQLNARVQEISDELTQTQADRDAASRLAAERLRMLAAKRRAPGAPAAGTATACERYEGPAVGVLRDETREALVDLARDADAVTDQLRSCQKYIREVVRPGEPVAKQ